MVLLDETLRLLREQDKRSAGDASDGMDSTCSTDTPATITDEASSDCDSRSISSDETPVEVVADSSRKTVRPWTAWSSHQTDTAACMGSCPSWSVCA
jgi:hypothetical protein